MWHQNEPDLKMDHHLFQPRPRVRRLLKVQITHIHTPQWKKWIPLHFVSSGAALSNTGAVLRSERSGNGSGEISGFANEVPARWASQQDAGAGQEIQVGPGNTSTARTHTHTQLCEERKRFCLTLILWRWGAASIYAFMYCFHSTNTRQH